MHVGPLLARRGDKVRSQTTRRLIRLLSVTHPSVRKISLRIPAFEEMEDSMKKSILILAHFVSAVACFGQHTSSAVEARIDAYLDPFVRAGHFSGVILASQDGKVIYEKAFGMANAEFKIPNSTDTRIGIASISKPMTEVILIHHIEENKVALADKVSTYIPDFPNGDKITIEMLSRHRSGIPHRVMKPEEEALPHNSAEMVERIKQAKLVFEPGVRVLYSSAGYTLLARILEIVSGKSYAQLLQEYVFTPSGMKESLDFNSKTVMERRAQEYLLDSAGIINAPLKDYSFLVGAGSVYSTARDLYRFAEAVASGRLGKPVQSNLVRNNIVSSNGNTNGHRAVLKLNIEKKYGYVLISNLASGAIDQILRNLEQILQGKEAEQPVVPHPSFILIPDKGLEEYAGKYLLERDGTPLEIIVRNNSLFAADIELYPVKTNCFFEYKYYGEACFVRDDKGRIKSLNWTGSGFKLVWIRQ